MFKHLADYNEGEEINTVAKITSSQLRLSQSNNNPFLIVQLADSSGEIKGIYWRAEAGDDNVFSAGTIVEIDGRRTVYQGQAQIRIYSMRVVTEKDGYDLSEFVKQAPEKSDSIEEEINSYVFEILNPTWNRIVRYLLKKWKDNFFSFPAGKSNHHAVQGGLAYHTVSMLRLAKAIVNCYPQVDKSLLYAGCILHDMGKVIELSGPVATQYTVEGNMIGHLVLIDEQIFLAANELKLDTKSEDLLLLRHMVLAHHGKFEYGSPKLPQLLEAEILHQIDDFDAGVYAITNALQHTKPGTYTDAIKSRDGRRFYRPTKDEALDQAKLLE
ncbi:hypothetical protein FC52_GL000021 [Lactobacillus pasteurii DSM 23907 = CRBIP 24.76]|uniref:CMP-binding-factor 1 n=1 Tax=Lactobacillus pasteurii DSM 23907 = CRBIP 24.76 TaxID=1423790 RepID=I7JYT0_9LACO|nr:HD domain-containing protein [Lactobacillus pasteurii]KRK08328.1 hypothetical protein FC52_GL000021 [Lactobacillus pasteurii DSM 23907 = CRBIP 24.76]TDG75506.1 hypothetical protein C5L33_000391 [Lactobacillus pasteurii]CCI85815.1 CMP-binding-factor 1 [Lactobacillus pasteurii DSM 23907 = CRBIP 24.76]